MLRSESIKHSLAVSVIRPKFGSGPRTIAAMAPRLDTTS
jgi:hypothetical protein